MLGGYNYTKKKCQDIVEYYNIRKRKWYETFSLGDADISNAECCVLKIPQSNTKFNHLAMATHDKWVLW